MSKLSEKVSYLKGLAEGLNIKPDSEQNKLLLAIVDVLDSVAEEEKTSSEKLDELSEYVEEIDSDLSDIEEVLYEDEDEDEDDEDLDDEDDEDIEDLDDNMIQYECPYCHTVVMYSQDVFDMENEHTCPNCGRKIFDEDVQPTNG